MNYIKYYRMWLEDSQELELGTWCYMGLDKDGNLHQLNGRDDEPETLEQWLQWGYKIEAL